MCASFTPLGDALSQKLRAHAPLKKHLDTAYVIEAAESVFDEMFQEQKGVAVKPLFLKNRTLTVTCSSSIIAQEIRINQSTIVEKINLKIGKSEVDRIRYLA